MPDTTDNHELQLFSSGETNWSHNPDMNTLEEAVSLKRNRAPDTQQETPYQDAVFLDLTNGDIYIGDGSSWGSPVWTLDDIGTGSGSVENTDIAPSSVVQYDTEAPIEGHIVEAFDAATLNHYSLDTGPFSIVQSPIEGASMLRFDAPSDVSGQTSFHMPSDVSLTSRGHSYSAYVRGDPGAEGTTAQYGFAVLTGYDSSSITDGFVLRANIGDEQEIQFLQYDSGFVSGGGTSAPVSLSTNTWYRLELDAPVDTTDVTGRIFDMDDNLLQYVTLDSPGFSGTSGGFGWYSRVDATDAWAEFDLFTKQSLSSTPNNLSVHSPDIERLFVRSTDPANEYPMNDGTDFWIDTS